VATVRPRNLRKAGEEEIVVPSLCEVVKGKEKRFEANVNLVSIFYAHPGNSAQLVAFLVTGNPRSRFSGEDGSSGSPRLC
jgi:hypothetical protein